MRSKDIPEFPPTVFDTEVDQTARNGGTVRNERSFKDNLNFPGFFPAGHDGIEFHAFFKAQFQRPFIEIPVGGIERKQEIEQRPLFFAQIIENQPV